MFRGAVQNSNSTVGDKKVKPKSEEYRDWNEKDVAYIITKEDEKQAVNIPIKATNLPKPIYPKTAKTNGAVNVEVILDKDGKVVSAKAVSGDKAFYEAAETSAKSAKFEIPKIEFKINRSKELSSINSRRKHTPPPFRKISKMPRSRSNRTNIIRRSNLWSNV